MQVDWLENPVPGFNRQDDEVLKTYNKILRIQQKRLEEEYAWMCHAPFPAVMGAYSLLRAYPLAQLQVELDVMYESQFLELEDVEDYIDSIATLAGLKRHLKQFAEDLADFGW